MWPKNNDLVSFNNFKKANNIPKLNPGIHDRVVHVMSDKGYELIGTRFTPDGRFKSTAADFYKDANVKGELIYYGQQNLHVRNNMPYFVTFFQKRKKCEHCGQEKDHVIGCANANQFD